MTPKAARTRSHLLDSAMAAFAEGGFAATSLRSIALRAEVSVGLAYRYFPTKEAIVLAFYERVADELVAVPLRSRTLGGRFTELLRAKLALLGPHRRAMGALLASLLDPESPIGLLSPATEHVRRRTREAFGAAVAVDGVEAHVEALTTLAWFGQALLLLAWVQRPEATEALLSQVGAALDQLPTLLWLPPVGGAVSAAASALSAFESPVSGGAR